EPHNLPQAVSLVVATHEVSKHVGSIRSYIGQEAGAIDSTERKKFSRPRAAVLAELALEGGLQRVPVYVIRGQKIPFLAELLDQRVGNCIGFHRRCLADAKDVPAAMTACDFIRVAPSHDVELSLFRRYPHHGESDRQVYVSLDERDLA